MNVDGKSVVLSDDKMQAYEFKSVPGYEHTLVWVDPTTPNLRNGQDSFAIPPQLFPDLAAQVFISLRFHRVQFLRTLRLTAKPPAERL